MDQTPAVTMHAAYSFEDGEWRTVRIGEAARADYAGRRYFCHEVADPDSDDPKFRVYPRSIEGGAIAPHFAHSPNSGCDGSGCIGVGVQHHDSNSDGPGRRGATERSLKQVIFRALGIVTTRVPPSVSHDVKPTRKRHVRSQVRRLTSVKYEGAGPAAVLVRDGQVIETIINGKSPEDWPSEQKILSYLQAHERHGNRAVMLWDMSLIKVGEHQRAQSSADLKRGLTVEIPHSMNLYLQTFGRACVFDRDGNVFRTSWKNPINKGFWKQVTLRNTLQIDPTREVIAGEKPAVTVEGNGARRPGLVWRPLPSL